MTLQSTIDPNTQSTYRESMINHIFISSLMYELGKRIRKLVILNQIQGTHLVMTCFLTVVTENTGLYR